MPQCASGQQCQTPHLPTHGTGGLYLHPCHICALPVHNFCAVLDEQENHTVVICRCCLPTWEQQKQLQQQQAAASNSSSTRKKPPTASKRAAAAHDDEGEEVDDEKEEDFQDAVASPEEDNDPNDEAHRGPHSSVTDPTRLENPYSRHSAKSSHFWRYFHSYSKKHPDNWTHGTAGHACCNICGATIKISGGSTTSLKQHLRSHHKPQLARLQAQIDKEAAARQAQTPNNDDAAEGHSCQNKKHDSVQPPERLVSPFANNSTKSSVFWKFFHIFAKEHPDNFECEGDACCNLCGKAIRVTGGSTSSLKNHLKHNHGALYQSLDIQEKTRGEYKVQKRPKATVTTRTRLPYGSTTKTRQYGAGGIGGLKPEKQRAVDRIHRGVALWVIQSQLPSLSVVEDPSFVQMLGQVRAAAAQKNLSQAELSLSSTGTLCSFEVKQQMHVVAVKLRQYLRKRFFSTPMTAEPPPPPPPMVGATHHWMARDNGSMGGSTSYAALSAFFVRDFRVQSVTLEAVLVDPQHQHRTCRGEIEEDLTKRWDAWNLDLDSQIPFAVSDTEPKSNRFGVVLDDLYNTQHLYSIDQSLQEITSIAFQSRFFGDSQNGDDSEVLRKARSLARLLASSSAELESMLKEAQVLSHSARNLEAALPAIEDTVQCWWSTYNMVSRLVKFRSAIAMLVSNGTLDVTETLSPKDWLVLDDLVTVLKPFSHAIKALQGAKFVTVSLVPHILPKIRADLKNVTASAEGMIPSREVVQCATEMLHAFDYRFGSLERPYQDRAEPGNRQVSVGLHKAFYFAMLLDPRFKSLAGTPICDEHKEKIWEGLETEMRANETVLRQAKAAAVRKAAGGEESSEADAKAPAKRRRTNMDDDDDDNQDYFLQHFGQFGEEEEEEAQEEKTDEQVGEEEEDVVESEVVASLVAEDIKSDCASEIAMYRQEKGLKFVDRETGALCDPLSGWWKERHENFPILWRLAQTYLAIPATTDATSPGASFSNGGNIVLPQGTGSTDVPPELAEDIILVKLNSGRVDGVDFLTL